MKKGTKEFLVGCLVLLGVGLIVGLSWLLGGIGSFRKENHYQVKYSFAGGIEIGSPVRVSGVKVGKVEKIEFLPAGPQGDVIPATLTVLISVSPKAATAVRENSKFYVNMAGIIGERYIEISPGAPESPILPDLATVRGVDPPRVDQLLSQGYGVFGRIQELLEQNEESVTDFLTQLDKLLKDTNQFLKGTERKRVFALIDNLNELTQDARKITAGLQDPEVKEMYRMLFDMIKRGHEIDKAALRKFLQEEGVRARIF